MLCILYCSILSAMMVYLELVEIISWMMLVFSLGFLLGLTKRKSKLSISFKIFSLIFLSVVVCASFNLPIFSEVSSLMLKLWLLGLLTNDCKVLPVEMLPVIFGLDSKRLVVGASSHFALLFWWFAYAATMEVEGWPRPPPWWSFVVFTFSFCANLRVSFCILTPQRSRYMNSTATSMLECFTNLNTCLAEIVIRKIEKNWSFFR